MRSSSLDTFGKLSASKLGTAGLKYSSSEARRNREVIEIVKVEDRDEGNVKAHDILKGIVDSQTLLALSGGTSPDYRKMIVEPADILPGVVCMVDERWGPPLHKDSNELLIESSGLLGYLDKWGVEFYRILKGKTFEETAVSYNTIVAHLFSEYKKKVGIMGIGSNLHTAGLFPNSEADHSPHYVVCETVDDEFPKRISLSLKALGEFDNFVILVFWEGKKEALKKLLDEGENDMQKYPAIFYRKCKAKSWLITDQDI